MQAAQRIFISYRRSDCQSQANGLNDGLRNRLPDAQIFMDLDSIPPGADFEEHIRGEIDQCDVVLVMIGDEWLAPRPGTTERRIDEPNDFVRLEVMSALRSRRVLVIPVLVEGAQMPQASDLPDDIARLARLNAFELSDSRWSRDLETLTGFLRGTKGVEQPARRQPEPNRSEYPTPAPAQPRPATHATPLAQPAPTQYARPQPAPTLQQPSKPGRWVYLLPFFTIGLLAFIPPLWCASRLKYDPARRRRMLIAGGVLAVLAFLAFVLITASPTDAEGSPTGPMSDLGAFFAFVAWVFGVIVGRRIRKPSSVLPGTAEELRRRELRLQYRDLAQRDNALAGSMRVGRPDLGRDYDDGGLVDVNSMPAEGLVRFAGLSTSDASEVVRARTELGRLTSVNELEAFSALHPEAVRRLREVAVFV